MSKFLHSLFSLRFLALGSEVKLFEFVFSLQPLESVNGNKTQKNDGKEHVTCTIKY